MADRLSRRSTSPVWPKVDNPTKLGQSLKQRLYKQPNKVGTKPQRLYRTTEQRWDKVLNRDYIYINPTKLGQKLKLDSFLIV